jgi:predicted peptidase
MRIATRLEALALLFAVVATGCTPMREGITTSPAVKASPQAAPAQAPASPQIAPAVSTPAEPVVKAPRQTAQSGAFSYWLYLPPEYGKTDRSWPLVMFLHGAGERGDNLDRVKVHGPPKLIDRGRDFPFIVISPQCPKNQWWPTAKLFALLDDVSQKHTVDKDRVYLTGLSMGGFGTWAMACEQPNRFAAIIPICGGGDPKKAAQIRHIPTWVFHGGKDGVVPISRSQDMVDALRAAGGEPKLTIYPNRGHDSWTPTYANDAVYEWMLKQRRPAKP